MKKGSVFVVSAPSGTGKNTLLRRLIKECPYVVENISYTTRAPRPRESQGKHYHFVSEEEFKRKISEGDFLEYARFMDHYYGTCRKTINTLLNEGKHVVLVIDTQGAMQLKDQIEATFIFLSPPSFEELERRLTKRNTENKDELQRRIERAREEMEYAKYYDYNIINDDIETAYQEFKRIFILNPTRKIII